VTEEYPRPKPVNALTVPIAVLHQDPRFVVVHKPSGLAVHRGLAQDTTYALQRVRDLVGCHVYPVHRLDRPTSGALLMALDKEAARILHGQFDRRSVTKVYNALVRGRAPDEGVIDSPMSRDSGGVPVDALTQFTCLQRIQRASWLEVRPQTGRKHQIRRHLRRLNHPLLGDVALGDGKANRVFRARCGLWRLALHASSIAFDHPETGERLQVGCPLPQDLALPLARLGIAL
jgi:tRNA pseudouridine65 synthase